MKMEHIECSEGSARKIQTPRNHPEERAQHVACCGTVSMFVNHNVQYVFKHNVYSATQNCVLVTPKNICNHPGFRQ